MGSINRAQIGWDNFHREQAEIAQKNYEFWSWKLENAIRKGNKKAEEEARKQLEYLSQKR